MHILEAHEHELKVLCCLFGIPADIRKHGVRPEEFSNPRYKKLFEKLLDLLKEQFEVPSYSELIKEASRRAGVDANDVLDEIPISLSYNLEQLRLGNRQEQIRNLALEVESLTGEELAGRLIELSADFSLSNHSQEVDLGNYLSAYREILKQRREKDSVGICTGFKLFDEWVCMEPMQLITLAARPAVGKSSLAMNLAYNAAQFGSKVCYISLEMSVEELTHRIYAHITGLSSTKFKYGNVDDALLLKCENEIRGMQGALEIKYLSGASISDILQKASMMQMTKGLDLLIIDHIDLIQDPGRKNENEATAIGRMTGALKAFAGKKNCAVLCLSQLNREAGTGFPELHQLRGSGAKEQDSDAVLILHRNLDPDAEDKTATLRIAKNRSGLTGDIPMHFENKTTTFKELK